MADVVNPTHTLSLATTKRKSFEHERELRVFAGPDLKDPRVDLDKLGKGLRTVEGLIVPVDLDELIVKVYVAPAAPSWFGELVASIMRRYGCSRTVVNSPLYARPML